MDKKINNGTNNRVQILSRHVHDVSANKKSHIISESSEYIKNIRKYFNINRPGHTKDLRNIGALER